MTLRSARPRPTAKRIYRRIEGTMWRDVLRAWRSVAVELHLLAKDRRGRANAAGRYDGALGLRLNVGCGADIRPGWVNVDLVDEADVVVDARRGLPLPDGCAALVHSEHFLEHLSFPEEVMAHLADVHRLLQPGGHLSICVPDAGGPLREYAAGGGELLDHARSQGWHGDAVTAMDQVNALFRQGGQHRYAWDAETLVHYLEEAGFEDAAERRFDPETDSAGRRIGSLYVGARKGPA